MRKLHYGWVIVGAGMMIIAMASGLVNNCFSLFIVPVCSELGFTRAQMGVCQTIYSVGCVAVALSAGVLFRKLKLLPLMRVAAIALILSYFLYSRAQTLWAFYACSCAAAVSVALITWMPFSVIINNWFHARRALAIGLTFMGSGLGGMAASAAGAKLIGELGWRSTIVCFSCALAAVLLPLLFFVVRVHPRDKGMAAYGEKAGAEDAADSPMGGMKFADALKTPRFYLLAVCLLVIGMANNGLNATLAPHMVDSGYTQAFSAGVFSVYMLLLAAGKMSLGYLFDRIGARRATALALSLALVSLFGLAYCNFRLALAVMLAGCGIGTSYGTVGVPVLSRTVYGQRDYAAFTGIFNASVNIGSALAPTILGLVCDFSGSYASGYVGIAIILAVCGAVVCANLPSREAR